MNKEKKIIVAATQMSCSWELKENMTKAKKIIHEAAKKGANIILLQELFQTPYFCIEYDEKIFRLAKPFENNEVINEMNIMNAARNMNENKEERNDLIKKINNEMKKFVEELCRIQRNNCLYYINEKAKRKYEEVERKEGRKECSD